MNESQTSTSVTGCNSISNHSSLGGAKLQPFMADQQEDCFEHCFDGRISKIQQREDEDEHTLLSCSESSQESQVSTSTYTCTSATHQASRYSQESVKDGDIQTQTDFKSSLSMMECSMQTINIITRESSTQWNPGDLPSLRDPVAEMPPAHSNQLSSEAATQTEVSISSGFCGVHAVDGNMKNNVVFVNNKDVPDAASTKDVEKMKEEIICLKRELGVTQSTLIWQSLMTRLHQL